MVMAALTTNTSTGIRPEISCTELKVHIIDRVKQEIASAPQAPPLAVRELAVIQMRLVRKMLHTMPAMMLMLITNMIVPSAEGSSAAEKAARLS